VAFSLFSNLAVNCPPFFDTILNFASSMITKQLAQRQNCNAGSSLPVYLAMGPSFYFRWLLGAKAQRVGCGCCKWFLTNIVGPWDKKQRKLKAVVPEITLQISKCLINGPKLYQLIK
jgi:hypothetical protein